MKDSLSGTFAFTAIAGATINVGTVSTNHAPIGNVNVRPLSKGQQLTRCIGPDFKRNNSFGLGCNGTATNFITRGLTDAAGQTRDLGALPFKTWTIRLDSTGALNSADNTQFDNLTPTQTFSAASGTRSYALQQP